MVILQLRFCSRDFLFPLQDIYFLPRVPTKTDRKCRCPYRLRHRSWALLRARGIFLSVRVCNFSYSERRAAKQDTRATRNHRAGCKSVVIFFSSCLFPQPFREIMTIYGENCCLLVGRTMQRRIKAQCTRYVALGQNNVGACCTRCWKHVADLSAVAIGHCAHSDFLFLFFFFFFINQLTCDENDDWLDLAK